MQGSSGQKVNFIKESTLHPTNSGFSKSISKSQKLINSPKFKTVTTKMNEKKNYEEAAQNSIPNKRHKIRTPIYFTDNIYTENFVLSRGKLTPEPILKYDKKYIRVQKYQDDQLLRHRESLAFKTENQSFQNGVLANNTIKELSGEEIESYLTTFTKRMQNSTERAKQELLKRTVCSEKLLINMQKVQIAKRELEKRHEKHSFEKIKKLGISMIESSVS